MHHIKSILPQVVKKIKIGQGIDGNMVCRVAEKIIKKSTPDVEVLFYENKKLGVRCFNSVIANEIFLNQEKIKNQINQFLKQKAVKKIVIKS